MVHQRKDGFEGQKLISLPGSIYKNARQTNPLLSQLFITHIGYFPKAAYHYRERKKGCDDNILIYCLSGKGWYMIGNKKYTVGPNQFIHLPATSEYMLYGADEEDPWTIYWVHYSGKDMATFNKSLSIKEKNGPVNITFNEKAIGIWDNMYQSLEMGYSKDNLCNANLCLYHFLATFFYPEKHLKSAGERQPDVINSTIHYMRSNLQKRINIDEFAALNHLSASYFSSLFRKATGMPPGDYFIQLKMQKACQMLYDPGFKIKEVAYSIGYDDPHYFSRIFKKLMGISPEQYRYLRTKDTKPHS
ncbi:AraC family transcriptional regulator [Pedobacter frigoris]|uniref:AraC family transcriptional regulator n=1 Tax=Pedobacter frigoris TaxID=2571272 RepID=A0A4U1CMT8_9SPHI|nr:AraC family transcriptional regulator [Pedobacter frigoris]TKC08526.1 AraC family transcriptional regulator [Pedobacter frigoris]